MLTVIKKIKPGKWEESKANKAVHSFLKQLAPNLDDLTPELGGSFAKGTWLSGDHDIDLFIKFPYERYKHENLSEILRKKLLNPIILHGSRDYFQLQYKGYLIELIPVLDIKDSSQAVNVTDVSPLHAKWVKANIHNHNDEVRLAKQFTKAHALYGAESYIRGFSGYLLEVLTIHYKGFFNLVTAASAWQQSEVIDPENYYKNKEEAIRNLNEAKHNHLVVIDPVQQTRNIAAALSGEKYNNFIQLCKRFLHNPSTAFFERQELSLHSLKASAGVNHLLYIELKPLEGKKDIIGCKLLKVFSFLRAKMEAAGFSIIDSGWEFHEISKSWFIIENHLLSEHRKHYGPLKHDKENLNKFITKWHTHELHEEAGRAYIMVKREHRKAEGFVKHLLAQDYCRENYKKVLKIKVY